VMLFRLYLVSRARARDEEVDVALEEARRGTRERT